MRKTFQAYDGQIIIPFGNRQILGVCDRWIGLACRDTLSKHNSFVDKDYNFPSIKIIFHLSPD